MHCSINCHHCPLHPDTPLSPPISPPRAFPRYPPLRYPSYQCPPPPLIPRHSPRSPAICAWYLCHGKEGCQFAFFRTKFSHSSGVLRSAVLYVRHGGAMVALGMPNTAGSPPPLGQVTDEVPCCKKSRGFGLEIFRHRTSLSLNTMNIEIMKGTTWQHCSVRGGIQTGCLPRLLPVSDHWLCHNFLVTY